MRSRGLIGHMAAWIQKKDWRWKKSDLVAGPGGCGEDRVDWGGRLRDDPPELLSGPQKSHIEIELIERELV